MVKLTFEPSELTKFHKNRLPKGVKVSPPSGFNGVAIDGDSIKKLYSKLWKTYFDLITVSDLNYHARFAENTYTRKSPNMVLNQKL